MKKSKSKPKKPISKKTKPTSKGVKETARKIMLVYGYDEDAQPRAAAFTEPDLKLAKKAAGLLGLDFLVAPATEMGGALKGIKSGNVYASGYGFAPKIPQRRFEEVLSALKLTSPVPPASKAAHQRPASWKTIAVGDIVLAQHDDATLGYWETIVEGIAGETLTLRARDFPEVTVKRHWATVALLYTADYQPAFAAEDAAPGLPIDWLSVRAEQLVLVSAGRREGYYPARVSSRADNELTVYWRDEPDLPKFQVPVKQVALLYPLAP